MKSALVPGILKLSSATRRCPEVLLKRVRRHLLVLGFDLLPVAPVVAHVPLQLRAVGEGVAAVRAAVVVLARLVPILDVFLQRGVALVAPRAVGARVQLGEGVRCSCGGEHI